MGTVGQPELDLVVRESSGPLVAWLERQVPATTPWREPVIPTSLFTMSVAAGSDGLNDVYEALDRYNWDDDVEFQSGLSAILGSNSTPEQAAELTLRARCFYYSR